MSSITIKDIAKALNISTSTVSRALRDSYDINPETKRKVVEYAEKMNYRPNPIAVSLKENKSKSIGVIVPEIANNYFSQAINGIEDIAYQRGYHVVIFQSHEKQEREAAVVQHLFARKVDGLLISLSGSTSHVSHIEKFDAPVVYFDRVPEHSAAHKVVANNFEGAYKATEYLIRQGKRNIAHITSPPSLSITQERLSGYKAALENNGIEVNDKLIKYCGFTEQEYEDVVGHLLKSEQPDAFFLGSDRLALGCYKAFKKFRPNDKDDIPLVGFTNLNVAHLLAPPLFTITQPAFKIGQEAAQILLDQIENKRKGKGFETIKLDTELHIR